MTMHPRRAMLGLLATAPFALALSGRSRASEACYDPASLPAAQKSFRKSLGFVEQAKDAKRACGGCAFFTDKGDGCGTCQLLSGGPVPASGSCNSFAARS